MTKYLHIADSSFPKSDLELLIFHSLSMPKVPINFRQKCLDRAFLEIENRSFLPDV